MHSNKQWYVVLALVTVVVGISVLIRRDETLALTDAQNFGKRYAESQYVMGEGAINKIDDSAIYTYAAIAYLKGEDPATINFEHPPLGKYFFGIAYAIFQRVHVANIVFFAGILLVFYALCRVCKFPEWFSISAIIYLGLFSSIANHLRTALLDLQVLFFSLLFFLLLFSLKENWKKYLYIGLCLGCLTAIKYFFPVLLLYYAILFGWAVSQKQLRKSIAAFVVIAVVYLSTYTMYFLHSHTLVDLVRFEWFRYNWWTNGRTTFSFSLFETLFTGSFPVWWSGAASERLSDSDWNVSWPILFTLSTIAMPFIKLNKRAVVLISFNLGLLAIYIAGSAVFGRYLFQLLPIWILLIGTAVFFGKHKSGSSHGK